MVVERHIRSCLHVAKCNQIRDDVSPTILPVAKFNAEADAEVARKAVRGWGRGKIVEENNIRQVLTRRN